MTWLLSLEEVDEKGKSLLRGMHVHVHQSQSKTERCV